MWITALTLGFAGSLHCLGMCSPLAWMVTGTASTNLLPRLVYNLGRIGTYAILGVTVGALGSLVDLSPVQFSISISIGIALVLLGVFGSAWMNIPAMGRLSGALTVYLKRWFSTVINKKGLASKAALGMINGLLPCGLTYIALSFCVLLEPAEGFAFMALFGIGTLPAMIGLPALASRWLPLPRLHFNKLLPLLLIVAGSWLVVRSYLSHPSQENVSEIPICR